MVLPPFEARYDFVERTSTIVINLLLTLRRGLAFGMSALLIVAMAACAPADEGGNGATDGANGGNGGTGGTTTVSGGTVEITADDLAFNLDVIEAPAGEAFTVIFENLEAVPHNWAIYTEEGGEEIAKGAVINEGETDEIEVPSLEPGEYFFVCDVHPQEMTGTVRVEG